MHARLFSARVHSSYETSLELVSHKLSRKLVSEIRHFSHPRWLPSRPLLFSLLLPTFSFSLSLHHAPPALLYAASSIVVPPFSTRNLLLTKGRTDGGRSSHRQIESALHFGPLHSWLRAHYAPVTAIHSSFLPLSHPLSRSPSSFLH